MRALIRIVLVALALMCAASGACADVILPTLEFTAPDLTGWGGKSDVRTAEMHYYDAATLTHVRQTVTLKPQGTSSLQYDKKNFTLKLETPVAFRDAWGAQDEYCLKANFTDPTMACNVVSARLAAQMNARYGLFEWAPNRGQIDGFPVWVTFNGANVGLYTFNIPKAAWLLGMDESNPDHIVMSCEGYSNSSLMWHDYYHLEDDWSLEIGHNTSRTVDRFTRLLDFVANASNEDFVAHFDEYLNLDACLNYYCFISISNASDNTAKNMLMVTWDGQVWYPVLYDLDSLWGISWDGLSTLPSALPIVQNNNRLMLRLRTCFGPQLEARYAELRRSVLSEENILREFRAFEAEIPPLMYRWNSRLWNADGARIRTLPLMEEMIRLYLPAVDAAFHYQP